MRRDIDRAGRRAAFRIEGGHLISGRKPDVPTVKRHAVYAINARKAAIFANNFGC
jgi:hypothetical protein